MTARGDASRLQPGRNSRPVGTELQSAPTSALHASVITDACSAEVGADCNSVPTGRLFRPGWSRDASPRAVIGGNQPGSAPTSAPLLVVQGTGDPLIPYLATTDFVDRQPCRADGDT